MTRGAEHLDAEPEVIPAKVNIHHLQLRDLLQPSGVKDKILFVSRLSVEQADFTTLKVPSTYCSLDFQPNCLTTGCGLLAAGGQHGELALRPLHSPSSSAPQLHLDSSYADRPPAPWLLRTPTGGSINNAITIQADLNAPSSFRGSGSISAGGPSSSPSKADVVDFSSMDSFSPWARDEPSTSYGSNVARPGLLFGDEEMESELSESVFEELAAAYGFDASSINRSSRWRHSSNTRTAATASRSTSGSAYSDPLVAPIKVMVSNNDQSIKLYKLRPPKSHPGAGGRIESGLPGLSRNTTLHFPTAINHSSLSPDQRTLIAVGDTPEVFIHSVSRSGEHVKVATYSASSDACFSTTWSPDGSKFAVASQDGVVSVWDVRSSRRLAAVSTSQAAMGSGNGAARVAKFSPDGRYLAFTEHRNFFHVTDTVTFAETQRIAAPTVSSSSGEGRTGSWDDAALSTTTTTSPSSSAVGRRIALSGSGMLGEGGERFRMLTGGEEAIARDRERRSMIHATFMREWNRAINLVDRGPSSRGVESDSSAATTASVPSYSRATSQFPNWLTNPTATSSVGSRRDDLLSAALTQTGVGLRPSGYGVGEGAGHSVNVSGLCWDQDSEAVYVSTERAVAKYSVLDTRYSSANADLL